MIIIDIRGRMPLFLRFCSFSYSFIKREEIALIIINRNQHTSEYKFFCLQDQSRRIIYGFVILHLRKQTINSFTAAVVPNITNLN